MKCQSCGRQSGQEKYCTQCTDEKGNLKTFDEIAQNLTEYFIETQGFDREVAKSAAIGVMSRQPAWERKIEREERGKDMRMKTFLIVTAAIFTVVGAGLAYWMGTKTKADDSIKFNNFSKLPQAPFENIEKSKVDMFDVYEMKCPADQKLVELDGDFLTIKSLEGSEFSPDYQLYTYNTAAKTGYKFVPESLATRTQLMSKGSGLVFEKSNSGTRTDSRTVTWHYSPDNGTLKTLKGIMVKQYGKTVLVCASSGLKAIDSLTGTVKLEIPGEDSYSSAISDNFMVYHDSKINKIVIHWFNGKKIYLPHPAMVMDVVANNDYVIVNRGGQKEISTTCYYASTGDVIWKKGYLEGISISPVDQDGNSVVCWISSRPNPQKKDVKDDEDLGEVSYIRMSSPDVVNTVPIPSGYEDKDMYPISLSSNLIAWDCYRHNWRSTSDSGWNSGTVLIWDLWVYDIANDINLQLDSKNCDTVLVDGWKVAWEKYAGKDNEQFYNVKFVDLFFDDENGRVGTIDGKTKFTQVELMKEPIKITELRVKGEQTTRINDYLYVSGNENFLLPIQTVGGLMQYSLFNLNTNKFARLKKDDPDLPTVLGGNSVEWMCDFKWEFDDSGNSQFKQFYTSYDSSSKKFSDDRLEQMKPKYGHEKKSAWVIDSKGNKKTVFTSQYQIHAVYQQKIEKNNYLIITIYDNSYRLSGIHVYDCGKDSIVYSDQSGYKCSPLTNLCGKYLSYQLSLDRWKTVDMETGKIVRIDKELGKAFPQNALPDISPLSPKEAADQTLFTRLDGEYITIKATDYLNGNFDKGTKMKTKISKDEGCTPIDDHRYIVWDVKNRSNRDKTIAYGTLTLLDDATGMRVKLSDNYVVGSFQNFGDFICWTINRGRKDSQYANVCYAKIK